MPTTQYHKIHHAGRIPISPVLLVVYIPCLVCSIGQHCIIKPLLLSWHIALHRFHESYVSTEPWGCQFECQIRTNFGQPTDLALMIENWSDGLKVKGVWRRNKICGTYRHRSHAHKQWWASIPIYTYSSSSIKYVLYKHAYIKEDFI